MRLRQIQSVLAQVNIKEMALGFLQSGATQIKISNLVLFKQFLEIVSVLPFLDEEVSTLKRSSLFSTDQNELTVGNQTAHKINRTASYLIAASESLARVLAAMLPVEKSNAIAIKVPEPQTLGVMVGNLSEIEKVVTQIVVNDTIKGKVQINNWEAGSFWIELLVGGQVAIGLIAGVAWSAAIVTKKIREGQLLGQHVRSLKIKNESLEDILEKQKRATALLVEKEATSLLSAHFATDKDKDNEMFERLKLAIKTFAELIQRGAEVHPALCAPEKVQNLFPDFATLEGIQSQIKQLTAKSNTDNGQQKN